ncbi:MAG TPA: phosphatase PAP2 family protein [Steroidobacteraceae bacterium]|nr:phosphatase PAP2 family protein [Steroidobacteraceae bacterium]
MRRSQVILASFAIFAVFVIAFPGVDLAISSLFFDGKTFLRDQWWQRLLQQGLGWFLPISVGVVALIYVCNRVWKRNICCVDARRVLYVVLVLAIGCGFIVNFGLKDHFHRARPRDVVEFGGTKLFSPAFQVSNQCRTNCSFSSGDAAGGFFSLALALALTRRRSAYVAALAVGVVMSFARISSGAHFFSDTVTSFFVMLIVADVLFFYLLAPRAATAVVSIPGTALHPAALTLEARE